MADENIEQNRITEAEPPAAESSSGEKTAYCAKCHRRHRLAAWPEGHPRGDANAETVVGAPSGQVLAQQTRDNIARTTRKREKAKEDRPLSEAEIKRRRESSVKLGRKIAVSPYVVAVLVTANTDWRDEITEKEITETAEDFADFCDAWGVQAAGKVVTAVALAMGMASTGGRVYGRVKARELEHTLRPAGES